MEEKQKGPKLTDLTNQRFGKLLVLSYDKPKWKCLCDCGIEKSIWPDLLKKGKAKSCGCLRGTGEKAKKDQFSWMRRIYKGMIRRCYNKDDKSYPTYGGRGITVCDRWKESFKNFREDMGLRPSPQHSLDRKDNNGNYCLENCRWATQEEQSNNKSTNIFLEFQGERLTISQWSRKLNLSKTLIRNRINRNLPIDQILSPIKVISTKEIANEKHTFRGESFTMKEWAEKLKVNYRSFKSLVRNRSLEYAVSFYRGEIKHEFWNRCDCCGKLISYEDFELGVATRRLICFESEEYETLCEKHKRS